MKKILLTAVVLVASALSLNAYAGGNIAAGKVLAQNCAACHGADFNTPIDPSYPKLAGQHQDYLEQALRAYQRGGEGTYGRSNAIMGGQVKSLSNKDIQNISAYIHSLPGSLVAPK